ncbi:MAG: sulfate ABC transporter substrate-binding protein [Planctomycetales bacterium]|nr:sulfate ABC transporter substrate-binding protein [Planctomycetales bacterium]MBN8625280.1 sulfate ABC transporter substrate-binding protein [Planctomycetota bacterium]
MSSVANGKYWVVALFALVLVVPGCSSGNAAPSGSGGDVGALELLNVSYDPTRELWKQLNEAFVPHYKKATGQEIAIRQSHGGSSSQARQVIDGLEADVVTLAIWQDIDAIHRAGLIEDKWEQRLPHGSLPYSSTIVFVVRKGNPKGVKDWSDLVKGDVQIVTPSPKTSGNGKLSFLAAWGSVLERGGSEDEARKLVTELYKRTPVLDSGARAATATFAQKGIGDVHLTWENEAHFEVAEAKGELEIVYPPISVLAEPLVSWVDANVKRKGTAAAAKAYLEFLYTPAGQEIIAKNFYRPSDVSVLEAHGKDFPKLSLFTVQKVFGGWNQAQEKFFAEGAEFDKIYAPAGK